MITRNLILSTARGWLGTPFHHQGRLLQVGVDCAGLIIGVARQLEMVAPDFDVEPYPRTPDGHSLMHLVDDNLVRVQEMRFACVVALRFGNDPQHLGIVGNYRHGGFSIIHASSRDGGVVETRLMYSNALRFVAAYDFPGVID
jgi:cell wall-associated NlpC family hydrolase